MAPLRIRHPDGIRCIFERILKHFEFFFRLLFLIDFLLQLYVASLQQYRNDDKKQNDEKNGETQFFRQIGFPNSGIVIDREQCDRFTIVVGNRNATADELAPTVGKGAFDDADAGIKRRLKSGGRIKVARSGGRFVFRSDGFIINVENNTPFCRRPIR